MTVQSTPDQLAEPDVVRLPAGARRTRVAATLVVLVLLLSGTLWGEDSAFPFGPFRMYSTRADPDAPVISTRVVGLTAAGEEVRLSGGAVGLRRAEFEGQLQRFVDDPALLGQVADAYEAQNPDGADLVEVQVVLRHIELDGGSTTGVTEDRVLVTYRLGGGS
ncbi:hypothetical protein [Goekera deserti]|uniref:hypothetical protein n=1 Tax=Goekera deserti TaxID=2497753 RepID=UPI00192EE30B|nr:hypothetical protein [Goekera deserti]